MNRLQLLLANKHAVGAAIAFTVGTGIEDLGPLWSPLHAAACVATGRWIKTAAFAWGAAMGGHSQPWTSDGQKQQQNQTKV